MTAALSVASLSPYYEPLGAGRGPQRAPAAPPRGPPSLDDFPQGRAARQPPWGGGGGAILGALPGGPPGTVSGPAPDTPPHPWLPAAVSTARRRRVPRYPRQERPHDPGRPLAGDDRGSTRASHWGARRLAVLARPPHSCAPAPLAMGRRDGGPVRKGGCDGPAHGPHTRGFRFPGNMSHYRIFQIVPLATHL